ncbi:hypothetical protein ACT8ZV_13785 [Nocardioides sp. MAHUQ-72]|uniref:hypothetical protein n=1 Tax=unclassified Nocardioides TaxID=2615069 RepID=UPI003609145A
MVAGAGADGLALSVHGPLGVLDLVVPAGAAAVDVAREYAQQSGLQTVPFLFTSLGSPLGADTALATVGISTGDLLVATTSATPPAEVSTERGAGVRSVAGGPGPVAVLWLCLAVGAAVLSGWFAARTESSSLHQVAVALLAVAAVIGVLPVGPLAAHRAVAAPAFAGAAAFAVAWDPAPERLPTVIGVAALVAAVAAAVARALDRRTEEALRVWIAVGVGVFLLTAVAALLGLAPQVPWAVLLLATMLAARFVPGFAIDVPDNVLIDLERLAVTAWSARDRRPGRRGRAVVSRSAVAAVASRGTRIVTAYSVAILVVATLSAPLLLLTVTLPIDRIGARCLVLFCGGGLLLAARSYRHSAARALLRTAGLACWVTLAVAVLPTLSGRTGLVVAVVSVVAAVLLVVVAVATGRGWRSAWWSRRAEVAEALCGSAAVATLLVAAGVFRSLWESVHLDV